MSAATAVVMVAISLGVMTSSSLPPQLKWKWNFKAQMKRHPWVHLLLKPREKTSWTTAYMRTTKLQMLQRTSAESARSVVSTYQPCIRCDRFRQRIPLMLPALIAPPFNLQWSRSRTILWSTRIIINYRCESNTMAINCKASRVERTARGSF